MEKLDEIVKELRDAQAALPDGTSSVYWRAVSKTGGFGWHTQNYIALACGRMPAILDALEAAQKDVVRLQAEEVACHRRLREARIALTAAEHEQLRNKIDELIAQPHSDPLVAEVEEREKS